MLGVTLWTRWVPVRYEHVADGTRTFYFGIGKVWYEPEYV